MTQFTTELLNFLAQKQDIDEFFPGAIEKLIIYQR